MERNRGDELSSAEQALEYLHALVRSEMFVVVSVLADEGLPRHWLRMGGVLVSGGARAHEDQTDPPAEFFHVASYPVDENSAFGSFYVYPDLFERGSRLTLDGDDFFFFELRMRCLSLMITDGVSGGA